MVGGVTVLTVAVGTLWVLADPPSTGRVLRAALFVVLAAAATALGGALSRAFPPPRLTPLDRRRPTPPPASPPADLRRALVDLRSAANSRDPNAMDALLRSWDQ
jgi:hypothetical protein